VLLWALRPQDFFPVKISFYRKLSDELEHELPSGRPDSDKLHSLIEFGRAFWKALEPQKPADWVDVQSFIWCVCLATTRVGPNWRMKVMTVLCLRQHHKHQPRVGVASIGRCRTGTGGERWEEFYEQGIAAIGWDETTDLRQFKNKNEIRKKIQELWPGDSSKRMMLTPVGSSFMK
jgi:hypothetical protein